MAQCTETHLAQPLHQTLDVTMLDLVGVCFPEQFTRRAILAAYDMHEELMGGSGDKPKTHMRLEELRALIAPLSLASPTRSY